ncbi:Aspartic protease PEP3 [Tolypocladium paradoxum]|uniref:Aspartic protease PEP3 n=1 Tax=Tolypocladium paradoxum TaxID=94208 RepID=A0A2S4KNF0_9HYPO|nr:Aspartic protease PEP3 [Tolypocladium paradoxum]
MQSTTLAAFLLASLLALVSAAPSAIQKRSFTVERVANPGFAGRNGPRALAKTYRKFGVPLPQELVDALAAQDTSSAGVIRRGSSSVPGQAGKSGTEKTGAVPAVPVRGDVEFLSPVRIGGQQLNVAFDTGSSDLWVFNTQLAAAATTGHRVYDPTKSKGFAMMPGATFRIRYGDGSGAEGNVGTDVVEVGGASVQAQAIGLATNVTAGFVADQNSDGLMGLGFSNTNNVKPQKQKTFFENVLPSLNEPVFTADLRKGAVGAYTFGAVDRTKFTGDLTWIPVNTTNGFWQFSSEKFGVGGEAAQPGTPGAQAMADTGTTLLLADPAIVEAYYSKVQGAQLTGKKPQFTVPCNAQLPDLDLDIGGMYMARVAGSDINFAPFGDGSRCFGGLQESPVPGLGIYGDILFKSQFVAFNGGNKTVGMAPHGQAALNLINSE